MSGWWREFWLETLEGIFLCVEILGACGEEGKMVGLFKEPYRCIHISGFISVFVIGVGGKINKGHI